MKFNKIKSYAKINLSLSILGRLNSKLHKIESLISRIDLYDDIFIKKIKSNNHKIIYSGKFSKKIFKNNTIEKLLNILDNKKSLSNQKYLIKVNKKIPQKSGLGGGSMNAASLFRYFLKHNKLKISLNEISQISSKIGSDVILGMQPKVSIFYKNRILKVINKKLKLYILLVKPNFGCSTKEIYKNVKFFSKSTLKKKNHYLNSNFIKNLNNDLEEPAFKKYPALKKLKNFMEKIDNVLFVRMTGSGSTIIGYFNSNKAASKARKILKKNYKNYWCILSKTI